MAAQRRSSVVKGMALVLALLSPMLLESQLVQSRDYTVGDKTGGWNTNVGDWVFGKSFNENDVLIFNYDNTQANVVTVDDIGYSNCAVTSGAQFADGGNDHITLQSGVSYFICSVSDLCQRGMKLTFGFG